uniref:Uncharacterized protein n=1 Tax=Micrurus lemniscatus lemniscatus TaxID=129467 RepID=A0A2D4IDL7_MICLE
MEGQEETLRWEFWLREERLVPGQLHHPAADILQGGLDSRLVRRHHDSTPRMEDVGRVDRLEFDFGAQLLQYPEEVQHEAIRRHQPIVRLHLCLFNVGVDHGCHIAESSFPRFSVEQNTVQDLE